MDGTIEWSATHALDTLSESPHLRQPLAARDWMQSAQQAWSFLPEDPTTAAYRLAALRNEVAAAPSGTVEPGLAAYVRWLHAQSERVKQQWLQECAARERRFRMREKDHAALPLARAPAAT